MAPNRIRENAVTLVAAAFFMPSVRKFLLPLPCYLLVAYRYPTHQILPHSRACHTQFPFSLLNMKKVPQPLEITVLSSLPAFSIHKVYLELTSLGSFLDANRNRHSHSDHRVVACADQTHHFYVSRNGGGTCKLCVGVHTS